MYVTCMNETCMNEMYEWHVWKKYVWTRHVTNTVERVNIYVCINACRTYSLATAHASASCTRFLQYFSATCHVCHMYEWIWTRHVTNTVEGIRIYVYINVCHTCSLAAADVSASCTGLIGFCLATCHVCHMYAWGMCERDMSQTLLSVYIYICIYIYIHIYIYIYMHTYIYLYTHTHICIYETCHTYSLVARIYIYIYIHIHVYVYTYICIYIYTYIYIYIYTYRCTHIWDMSHILLGSHTHTCQLYHIYRVATHSYVTWLIHMWQNSFIWDMSQTLLLGHLDEFCWHTHMHTHKDIHMCQNWFCGTCHKHSYLATLPNSADTHTCTHTETHTHAYTHTQESSGVEFAWYHCWKKEYVWHVSFIHVTWLLHMWHMAYLSKFCWQLQGWIRVVSWLEIREFSMPRRFELRRPCRIGIFAAQCST